MKPEKNDDCRETSSPSIELDRRCNQSFNPSIFDDLLCHPLCKRTNSPSSQGYLAIFLVVVAPMALEASGISSN